jgi:hypothetical protein
MSNIIDLEVRVMINMYREGYITSDKYVEFLENRKNMISRRTNLIGFISGEVGVNPISETIEEEITKARLSCGNESN